MKFIINKDKITSIENKEEYNSGSIKYYRVEVACDDSWQGLTIEAVMLAKEKQEEPVSIAVINGEMYIDKKMSGLYAIGFIGYRTENEKKTYQISTNLSVINFDVGAGEFETINSENIPEITEWEKYLAQVQEFIDNANEIIEQANNLDIDVSKVDKVTTIEITKKDGTTKTEDVHDGFGLEYDWRGTELGIKREDEQDYDYTELKGDCNFATFEINNNGELIMRKTENMLLDFNLNENGFLTVTI